MEIHPLEVSDVLRLMKMNAPASVQGQSVDALESGVIARVSWDADVFLLLVNEVHDSTVEGWPADVGRIRDSSPGRLLPASLNTLGVELTVLCKMITFAEVQIDRCVGAFSVDWDLSSSETLEPDLGADDGLSARAMGASRAIVRDASLTVKGESYEVVNDLLGVSPQRGLQLIRGAAQLDEIETARLIDKGWSKQEVGETSPEERLLRSSHFRTDIQSLANAQGITQTDAWRRAVQGSMALAARQEWADETDQARARILEYIRSMVGPGE